MIVGLPSTALAFLDSETSSEYEVAISQIPPLY